MALSSRQYDHDIISLDLGTARGTATEYESQGLTKKSNSFTVITLGGGSLRAKLNSNSNDSFALSSGLYISGVPISDILWYNTAQAGLTAEIFIVWVD